MAALLDPAPIEDLLTEALPPMTWFGTPLRGRRALLQNLLAELARISELPALTLEIKVPAGQRRGRYLHGRGVVELVRTSLEDRMPVRALGTLVHETRHAVQWTAVDEQRGTGLSGTTLARWTAARETYTVDCKQPGDQAHVNLLEVDARCLQHEALTAYLENAFEIPRPVYLP